jgi:hypothetical protein
LLLTTVEYGTASRQKIVVEFSFALLGGTDAATLSFVPEKVFIACLRLTPTCIDTGVPLVSLGAALMSNQAFFLLYTPVVAGNAHFGFFNALAKRRFKKFVVFIAAMGLAGARAGLRVPEGRLFI